MRFRADIVVTAVIVLLCTYAVVRQLGFDPFAPSEPEIEALAIGDPVDGDLVLDWIGEPPFPDRIGNAFGVQATVLYTWSIPCPCTDVLEQRMKLTYARFNEKQGVSWVAVDGEPLDTPERVLDEMVRLRAFYKMLLDPEQKLTRRLGVDQAVQVVVLDADGRIRYRGPPDHDYEAGDARFLVDALERVLAGEPVAVAERGSDYGCFFNDPASCLEYTAE